MQTLSVCNSCRQVNRVSLDQGGKTPVCGRCREELSLERGVTQVSASALLSLVEKSPMPVITDFWAPWCGPCKSFAPVFSQAAASLAGKVVFAKLDTQTHPLASTTYGIRSIPTLILFNGGFERARLNGAVPLPQLLDWIRQALHGQTSAA
jgi:thioredoxin 2